MSVCLKGFIIHRSNYFIFCRFDLLSADKNSVLSILKSSKSSPTLSSLILNTGEICLSLFCESEKLKTGGVNLVLRVSSQDSPDSLDMLELVWVHYTGGP